MWTDELTPRVEVRAGQVWIHQGTGEGWRVLRADPLGVWMRSTGDETLSRRVARDRLGHPTGFREPVAYCEFCNDGVPYPFSVASFHLIDKHAAELETQLRQADQAAELDDDLDDL